MQPKTRHTLPAITNMRHPLIFLSVLCSLSPSARGGGSGHAFDDTHLFKIKWPESEPESEADGIGVKVSGIPDPGSLDVYQLNEDLESKGQENMLWLKTKNQELYYCVLPNGPDSGSSGSSSLEQLDEIGPYELLKPLITREVCSYRLEQYWTYELCHGKYLRQFHEENAAQKVKSQEYFLGRYDATSQMAISAEEFEHKLQLLRKAGKPAPQVTVEGVSLPYIEFNFTGGTVCDLNNKPRVTRVLYVCSENAKHELHSIKETFTCEYEAIVLSPILCLHKNYKTDSVSEHDIRCHPVSGSPAKPKDLSEFESGIRSQSKPETLFDGKTIIFEATDAIGSNPGFRLIQVHDPETGDLESLGDPSKLGYSAHRNPRKFPAEDLNLVSDFLSGDFCLQGVSLSLLSLTLLSSSGYLQGSGWWKYELCYGQKVEQYHEEKGVRKSVISLGRWNREKHMQWLEQNPEKRPKKGKTPKLVSHFYSDGDVCPETGKPRHVEVKLKCKYGEGNSDTVALYLLEPQTCSYILGVSLFLSVCRALLNFLIHRSSLHFYAVCLILSTPMD